MLLILLACGPDEKNPFSSDDEPTDDTGDSGFVPDTDTLTSGQGMRVAGRFTGQNFDFTCFDGTATTSYGVVGTGPMLDASCADAVVDLSTRVYYQGSDPLGTHTTGETPEHYVRVYLGSTTLTDLLEPSTASEMSVTTTTWDEESAHWVGTFVGRWDEGTSEYYGDVSGAFDLLL